MPKYSLYLRHIQYNKLLDAWWYDELKKKLDFLEINKIKINFSELNIYLYQRYLYERGDKTNFDDTKYDIENFMQIVHYRNSGYDGDDEMCKKKETDYVFIVTMNGLADKLANFTMSY
jgi:hypothetical protein